MKFVNTEKLCIAAYNCIGGFEPEVRDVLGNKHFPEGFSTHYHTNNRVRGCQAVGKSTKLLCIRFDAAGNVDDFRKEKIGDEDRVTRKQDSLYHTFSFCMVCIIKCEEGNPD